MYLMLSRKLAWAYPILKQGAHIVKGCCGNYVEEYARTPASILSNVHTKQTMYTDSYGVSKHAFKDQRSKD